MINKSRGDEEANREDTSEIRSEKERGNYQEHWTLQTSCQRKKSQTKRTNNTNNPTEIQVSTFGKSFILNSFKIPDNPLETGRAWQQWLKDFKEETEYFEIKAVKDKVSALKIYGDKKSRNLPDTAPVEDDNDYQKLFRKLNNHFLQKKNKQHARQTFSKQ